MAQDVTLDSFDMTKASMDEMKARIAFLENKAREAANTPVVITQLKVSAANATTGSKGGNLSIYISRHRFPISMNVTQFDALDKGWERVRQFVKEHRAEFHTKVSE